jgi:hypothetical protein
VAAMLVGGFAGLPSLVQAGYELPPGERITNLPHIPRALPQKEAFENYDPVIGRNFDLKNFWLRADLRVRPEFRNHMCFGAGNPVAGTCNTLAQARANANPLPNTATGLNTGTGNTFFVQQWVRLGVGYDLSPDVNFYTEFQYSHDWGTTANPQNPAAGGGPALNNQCNTVNAGQCGLGIRAAYMLVRNLGGIQGLSMKAGRQYLIFGNHSLFGHFDWANTGFSHDGVLFNYATKTFETFVGWFREADLNIGEAQSVGGLGNFAGKAGASADLFILYNQIKSVPGMLIEPYYVLFLNGLNNLGPGTPAPLAGSTVPGAQSTNVGPVNPKANGQIRHMLGNRVEVRKDGWDFINETAYQFGRLASGLQGTAMDLHINAWATRNWLGYTFYDMKMKPRIAVNLDYASGDGNNNCNQSRIGTANTKLCGTTANTFENFYPTNHIHMGYADVIAWRNMLAPQANFQFRPTERDHFEFWYMHMRLANKADNWYRASQGPYIWTKAGNTEAHIGDETDFTWTRMFADGKVSLQATYGHIFAGAYIKQNLGTATDQQWGFVQLWMNF